jgi:hypothetical protein
VAYIWETEWTAGKIDEVLEHVKKDTPEGGIAMAILYGFAMLSESFDNLTRTLKELGERLPDKPQRDKEDEP